MVITLAIDDKRSIEKTNDINHIMQRMLLCEGNQLAKEHIGIIDMNQGSYIHDRRLIAPSCRGGRVELMRKHKREKKSEKTRINNGNVLFNKGVSIEDLTIIMNLMVRWFNKILENVE